MVYCTHCGAKNEAEALCCTNCSALLGNPAIVPAGDRSLRMRPVYRVGSIIGFAVGLFIVLAGGIWFLQQANLIPRTVELWPFAAVIFGVLFILGAVRGIHHWQ